MITLHGKQQTCRTDFINVSTLVGDSQYKCLSDKAADITILLPHNIVSVDKIIKQLPRTEAT